MVCQMARPETVPARDGSAMSISLDYLLTGGPRRIAGTHTTELPVGDEVLIA